MLEKYEAFIKKAKEVITGVATITGFTKLGTAWRDSFNWLGHLSSEEDSAKQTSEWVNRDINKFKLIEGQTQVLSGVSTLPFQIYAYATWPSWWIVSRPKWLLKKLPFFMRSFANIYSHDHRKWLGAVLPIFLFLLAASLFMTSPIAGIIFAILGVFSIPKINQIAAVIFEVIAHILIGAVSLVGAVLKTVCMLPELIARTLFYFFKATMSPFSSWKVKLPVALFLAGGILALHFFAPAGIAFIASSSAFLLKGIFITLMMWPMRKMMAMMHAGHGASLGFHYIAWPFKAAFHILPYGLAGLLSTVAVTLFAAATVFALVGIATKLGMKAYEFMKNRSDTKLSDEIRPLLHDTTGIQSNIDRLPDSKEKATYNDTLSKLNQQHQDNPTSNLRNLLADLKRLNSEVDDAIRNPVQVTSGATRIPVPPYQPRAAFGPAQTYPPAAAAAAPPGQGEDQSRVRTPSPDPDIRVTGRPASPDVSVIPRAASLGPADPDPNQTGELGEAPGHVL